MVRVGLERDALDLKFDRWLDANVADAHVVLRVNNFSHALTMVRAGLGIALLPLGDPLQPFLVAAVGNSLAAPFAAVAWTLTYFQLREILLDLARFGERDRHAFGKDLVTAAALRLGPVERAISHRDELARV